MRSADLALILTGVTLNAAAQLLLKAGARMLPGVPLQMSNAGLVLERALMNGPILLGLACYVVSVAFWILALTRVDVSVAYPMLSIGYVINAVAGQDGRSTADGPNGGRDFARPRSAQPHTGGRGRGRHS